MLTFFALRHFFFFVPLDPESSFSRQPPHFHGRIILRVYSAFVYLLVSRKLTFSLAWLAGLSSISLCSHHQRSFLFQSCLVASTRSKIDHITKNTGTCNVDTSSSTCTAGQSDRPTKKTHSNTRENIHSLRHIPSFQKERRTGERTVVGGCHVATGIHRVNHRHIRDREELPGASQAERERPEDASTATGRAGISKGEPEPELFEPVIIATEYIVSNMARERHKASHSLTGRAYSGTPRPTRLQAGVYTTTASSSVVEGSAEASDVFNQDPLLC